MTMPQYDPLGTVTITAREIYDAVLHLTGRVDQQIHKLDELAGDVRDHETRLRNLEKARWPLPSLAVAVSMVALVLGALPFIV